jgi:NAD+ synthase
MAGGYNVLKDVYKTVVSIAAGQPSRSEADILALVARHGPGLVQWRNSVTTPADFGLLGPAGRVVPHTIEAKVESAELAPGQRDADSLPPYPELDAILNRLIEGDRGIDEIVGEGFSRATVERVNTLLNRAEYKRRQGAPGPRITEMLFDCDRRVPLVNTFRG